MLKDSKILDDLTKMAGAAAGSAMDIKRELEAAAAARVDTWLARHHLVSRDEFEVVREMAQKARTENEALRAELDALKARPKAKQA